MPLRSRREQLSGPPTSMCLLLDFHRRAIQLGLTASNFRDWMENDERCEVSRDINFPLCLSDAHGSIPKLYQSHLAHSLPVSETRHLMFFFAKSEETVNILPQKKCRNIYILTCLVLHRSWNGSSRETKVEENVRIRFTDESQSHSKSFSVIRQYL